jgi:hypothetical protein
MEQELLDEQEIQPTNKRPVFLTVLCILTWIGSAFFFVLYLYQYASYSKSYNALKEMANNPLFNQSPEISNPFKLLMWSALIGCVCSLICAGGSIVMFTRRTWGFYVYLFAEIAPLIVVTYITLSIGRLDSISVSITAAMWIVPIGFIVMYALNLRYMRR